MRDCLLFSKNHGGRDSGFLGGTKKTKEKLRKTQNNTFITFLDSKLKHYIDFMSCIWDGVCGVIRDVLYEVL